MSRSLLVVLFVGVFIAGCTGETASPAETTIPAGADATRGRLVLWTAERLIVVDGDDQTQVTTSGEVSQVTPSQTDSRLVWTQLLTDPPSVHAVIDGDTRIEVETPTVPFYYAWDGVGEMIAFLGNDPANSGLVFGSVDVSEEVARPVENGAPFFLDWSPSGGRVAVHVAAQGLAIIEVATGEIVDLGQDSGVFPTPAWTERGILVVTDSGPTISNIERAISYQRSSSSLVVIEPSDLTRRTLAAVAGPTRIFASSEHIALAIGEPGSQFIRILDWDGLEVAELGQGTIDLVQWSPDGRHLLWTERGEGPELTPMTWSGQDLSAFQPIVPTELFATAYLPFWDQFDRTISLWSGDSTRFVLPASQSAGPTVISYGLSGETESFPGFDMAVWQHSLAG